MRLIILTLFLVVSADVFSFENEWYWALGVNNSKSEYFSEQDITETHRRQLRRFTLSGVEGARNNQFRIRSNDAAVSFTGLFGVRFHENFDWEFSFIDFGRYSISYEGRDFVEVTFDETLLTADYEISGFNAQLQWRTEVMENTELMFKAGLLWWDGQVSWTYNNFTDPKRTETINDRGYDESFGLGLLYRLHEGVAVRGYWDQFVMGANRTDTFTLSMQVSFNTVNWVLW